MRSLRDAAGAIPRGARAVDLSRNAISSLEGAGDALAGVVHLSLYYNKVGAAAAAAAAATCDDDSVKYIMCVSIIGAGVWRWCRRGCRRALLRLRLWRCARWCVCLCVWHYWCWCVAVVPARL